MRKFLFFTVVVIATIIMYTKAQIAGSLSESKPADPEVTELIDRQKENIIKKICDGGSSCPSSDAKIDINSYRSQPVSGTNYFISVTIDDMVYHVRIYSQPWTETEDVKTVQGPKEATDELKYFF